MSESMPEVQETPSVAAFLIPIIISEEVKSNLPNSQTFEAACTISKISRCTELSTVCRWVPTNLRKDGLPNTTLTTSRFLQETALITIARIYFQ